VIFHRTNSSHLMKKLVLSVVILLISLLCVGISSAMTGTMMNSAQPVKLLYFLWGIGMISMVAIVLYGLSRAIEKNIHARRNFVYNKGGNPNKINEILKDITLHKQAEEALKDSHERYKSQIELSSDSIIVQSGEKIVFANNATLKLMGAKSLDELTGKSALDFVHPDYKDIAVQRIQRIYDNEEKITLTDEKFIKLNGDVIDVEVTAILINYFGELSIQMIVRDITERKQNKDMLVKLKKAVETSGKAIFITDQNGIFKYVNPAFNDLYGYTLDEIIGRLTPQAIESELLGSHNSEMLGKILMNGQEEKGEFINKRKDGTIIDIESSVSPILDEMNSIIGFLGIHCDITKRKLAERELIKAKEHARESDRLKSAFLANLSHEIRTPMNGIMGFAEILKEPDVTGEEQNEYLSIIEQSGERMLNTLNDIIDLSKIESGQIRFSISETNVNQKMMDIYTSLRPEAEKKGLQISYRKNLSTNEAIINTDKEKLKAILSNLIKNAIKFTKTGFIEFGYGSISSPTSSTDSSDSPTNSESEPAELEFFVKDSGIGISNEQKEFIFERFRQGNESLHKKYEGAGLGLSISKAYVEMLGGKIRVESELGKGSVFYFTLPLNIIPGEKKFTQKVGLFNREVNVINNLKILIVEDDEGCSKYLSMAIKKISKEVLKARTGVEAVETCRNNYDIDLVLMDIQMPEMDGYEATRQIRQFNNEVVIIAESSFDFSGDVDKVMEAGCTDYISKPYSRKILLDKIKRYGLME